MDSPVAINQRAFFRHGGSGDLGRGGANVQSPPMRLHGDRDRYGAMAVCTPKRGTVFFTH